LSTSRRAIAAACALACSVLAVGALAQNQIPGPPGWEGATQLASGEVAKYRLVVGGQPQVLNATVYTNYTSLDDFVSKNQALIKSHPEIAVQSERTITVCGKKPAWEIVYSHPGTLPENKSLTFLNDQVTSVENSKTYIAGYLRLKGQPSRPEAIAWIHNFCQRV